MSETIEVPDGDGAPLDGDVAPSDSTVMIDLGLPEIPTVPEEQLAAWWGAHGRQARALDLLAPPVRGALDRWWRDRCLESMAGITPSTSGGEDVPLFPAPRAFLSTTDVARLESTRSAFDHVDVRLMLADQGVDRTLLRPETAFVLNALAEGGQTGRHITNPGQLRVKDSGWIVRANPYNMPPPPVISHLVDSLVDRVADVVGTDHQPSPALGGWAAFTFLSIHPFADGNGRTARLLYLLLASRGLPHVDLGAVERLGRNRRAYVDALQSGQWTTTNWDPRRLDPAPFVEQLTAWSTEGALLHERRANAIGAVAEAVAGILPPLDPGREGPAIASIVGAWLDRVVDVASLTEPIVDEVEDVDVGRSLESMVAMGAMERFPLPASRRRHGVPTVGYRLVSGLRDRCTEAAAAALRAPRLT